MSNLKYLKYKMKYFEQKGGVIYSSGNYLFFIPEDIYIKNEGMTKSIIPNSICISDFDKFTNNIGNTSFVARICPVQKYKADYNYNYKDYIDLYITIFSNNKFFSLEKSISYSIDYDKYVMQDADFNITNKTNHVSAMEKIQIYLKKLSSTKDYRVLYITLDKAVKNYNVYLKKNYIFKYDSKNKIHISPEFTNDSSIIVQPSKKN